MEKFVYVMNKVIEFMCIEYTFGSFSFSMWQFLLCDVFFITGAYVVGNFIRAD